MNPLKTFDKSNLFVLQKDDYLLAIVGYPEWRGFVTAAETNLWVEVIPSINVAKQTVILPRKKRKDSKDKDADTENEKKRLKIDRNEIKRFFLTIPSEIIESVSCFPDSHWELVKAVKLIGSDFLSLIKTNPALAYIIVNMEKINPSFLYYANIEILQRMISTKRKEILRLSGFPDTERMVKIFSKIDAKDLDLKLLLQLKLVLLKDGEDADRVLQLFSFTKIINKNFIHLLSVYTALLKNLNDRIIFELVEDPEYSTKAAILLQMHQDSVKWKVKFPLIKTMDDFDEIKNAFNKKVADLRDKVDRFPPPPLADNEYIKAITLESQLISWSKKQRNCVRDYGNKIRNHRSYIYKVVYQNEEATLEIRWDKSGTFFISELSGFDNRAVSTKLKNIVQEWLRLNNKKRV